MLDFSYKEKTMQVLVIERFTDKKYEVDSKKYLNENDLGIKKLYKQGYIRSFWSRGDKPG